ncbi:DUF1456 family protein [Thalassotalea euphylliae]|uniref:DUF1456 family protein n=1 Tax=Thalassotalea euphylliae TaxID=1655234 RepID=A0A3E0UFW1_9GAMM|nr:DUF1456 family protein [Thalassotalea euphylliae]REL35467.1 DUF1456 family protein [Thalassotalea euphylliae]
MTNNDILRRLRFTYNFTDKQICDIFALADVGVTTEQVVNWLRKDDDKDQVNLSDQKLAGFLNGWVVKNRGKKDGKTPVNEKQLSNNLILTKIKIALSLKAEDILALLKSVDFNLGKAELSAFFRKPDHKHFRQCKDQILRNLLTAIQQKQRPIKNSAVADHQESSANTQPNKHAGKPKSAVTNKKSKTDKLAKQGARPNKSKVYVNPNASNQRDDSMKSDERKTLKLKPEQIWGQKDK